MAFIDHYPVGSKQQKRSAQPRDARRIAEDQAIKTDTPSILASLFVLTKFAWHHRRGRKCNPNCKCEDYF